MTAYTIEGSDYTTDDVVAGVHSSSVNQDGVLVTSYKLAIKNPNYDQNAPFSNQFLDRFTKEAANKDGLESRKRHLQDEISLCNLYLDKITEVEAE